MADTGRVGRHALCVHGTHWGAWHVAAHTGLPPCAGLSYCPVRLLGPLVGRPIRVGHLAGGAWNKCLDRFRHLKRGGLYIATS